MLLSTTVHNCRFPFLILLVGATVSRVVAVECPVDISLHDAVGRELQFAITGATPVVGERPGADLLKLKNRRIAYVDGRRLVLGSDDVVGRFLRVRVSISDGREDTFTFVVTQCPQRSSFRVGEAEQGIGDVSMNSIKGRLTGCIITRDWWIRVMPMFGSVTEAAIAEGRIETNGVFSVVGDLQGERQIVVIGRGDQPVHAFGFNVTSAAVNRTGDIDISSRCPDL